MFLYLYFGILALVWELGQPVTAVVGGLRGLNALRSTPVHWHGVKMALIWVAAIPVTVGTTLLATYALMGSELWPLFKQLTSDWAFYCSSGVAVLIVAGVIFRLPAKR